MFAFAVEVPGDIMHTNNLANLKDSQLHIVKAVLLGNEIDTLQKRLGELRRQNKTVVRGGRAAGRPVATALNL
jgi:hypothetical protein